MKIALFDTETTGLLKPSPAPITEQPQIIEFYGVVVTDKGEFVSEFDTLLDPGIPISREVTNITHITDDMVAGKPSFIDAYPHIAKLFTGVDLLVAHNLSFDVGMLANELLRIDRLIQFPWPRHQVCTVQASMPIKGYRCKLCDLYEIATNKPFKDAHRAKQDVRGLYQAFKWLVKMGYIDLSKYEN